MTNDLLTLLDSDAEPDALLAALMPALGIALDCDRCVLFLRDPHSRRTRAPHRWQRKQEYAHAPATVPDSATDCHIKGCSSLGGGTISQNTGVIWEMSV